VKTTESETHNAALARRHEAVTRLLNLISLKLINSFVRSLLAITFLHGAKALVKKLIVAYLFKGFRVCMKTAIGSYE
jgi:hypothetical protein